MHISAYRLSKETGIPQTRVSQILKGNRRITADTALRFERFFGTTALYWLNLQASYDLEESLLLKSKEYDAINPATVVTL